MSVLRPAFSIARMATAPITITSQLPVTSARSNHSATQVKRLMKKNPARLRLLKKNGESLNYVVKVPPPSKRQFAPIFSPTFLKSGWSAPPPAEDVPDYPFSVTRTRGKPYDAVGFLPVYRDVRVHGTKHTTIIKRITGDIPTFINELRAVLQLPLGKKGVLNTAHSTGAHGGGEAGRGVSVENPLRTRAGGNIEIHGDRLKEVKWWLAGLGF